jgi:hypothetical protein
MFTITKIGKIPIDSNVMKSCEDGYGFLEIHPDSVASGPFGKIVEQIVQATNTAAEAAAAATMEEA